VVSSACFTFPSFVVLERHLDAASALAIVGGVWGAAAIAGFVALRR
jgi:hypothetical protein